jgi:hypothetical protein
VNTCIAGSKVIKWKGKYFTVSDVSIIKGEIKYRVDPSSAAFEAALLANINSTSNKNLHISFPRDGYTWFTDDSKMGEE